MLEIIGYIRDYLEMVVMPEEVESGKNLRKDNNLILTFGKK